jgi:hypothetical protein
MLADIIKNNFYYLVDSRKSSDKMYPIRGELEITASRNGEIFYYDKGPNTVTTWGKHVMMHVLTGESFSMYGRQRSKSSSDHQISATTSSPAFNNDGTQVSNEQHFSNVYFPGTMWWWSKGDSNIPSASSYIYPYFPTKMLFGTGFEYPSYTSMPTDFQTIYPSATWSWVNNGNDFNDYSNNFGSLGDTIVHCRTMNDIYSTTLTTPIILDTDLGISGAIKNGLYESLQGDSALYGKIESIGGNYFSTKPYWGIGRPSFIYCKRETRFFQAGSEASLDFDVNVENKVTYSVTLPEQTGTNAGVIYPYNGFVLKVAGLFCDSRFFLRNTVPVSTATSDDSGLMEYKNYVRMPHGIMIAKRYIAPITKSHDVSITCRWTLYL